MDLLQSTRALFVAGRVHDALESAQVACERTPRSADAWALLARVARHAGLPATSEDAFRRAAALSARHPVPVRVPSEEFELLVTRARQILSPDAHRRLRSTSIELQAIPDPDDILSGVDPDALSRRVREPRDRLVIFQDNLENRCRDREELAQLVARVMSRA